MAISPKGAGSRSIKLRLLFILYISYFFLGYYIYNGINCALPSPDSFGIILKYQKKGGLDLIKGKRRKRQARALHISLSLLLALSLMATPLVASAEVAEPEVSDEAVAAEYGRAGIGEGSRAVRRVSVLSISNTRTSAYRAYPIRMSDRSIGASALLINGMYYVPVRAFMSSISGVSVSYSSSTRTITISGRGLYMTATDGSYVVYANDRALFEMSPARLMSDGRMYIPASSAAKAFGLRFSLVGGELRFAGDAVALTHASRYYDADAVYWLSRIISAESRGEPLVGQIAVGNVILNRVRSSYFPNTIWGVIFDRKYGVQFSPVSNGTIYNAPAFTSTLAAKICLEGFSLSEDILYFLAPKYASSSWISKNRSYEFTVQNHEFYS